MKSQLGEKQNLHREREAIAKAGRLHFLHWIIIIFSLLLTITAWYFSKNQIDEKIETQFLREANQAVELITERMQKYEDGLWGGVSAIQAQGGNIEHKNWQKFANSLRIDIKYPGINGIGVIHHVPQHRLGAYLEEQRQDRPNYDIHPQHTEGEFWPITYVEPVSVNAQAVGLDMAHETNRYSAAKKARDTGAAQITGPIILVQDAAKEPGFLFYAPFYNGGIYDDIEDRRKNITGLVYAPFIVKKLMAGALEKEKRHVGISIIDGDKVLYNEHVVSETDYDANPLFKKEYSVQLYGRTWLFDIWSAKSFRAAASSSQPLVILLGGIFIDSLLLLLFLLLSRSNRRAIEFADRVTFSLQDKTTKLERSNEELEQFAYVASHDLQEPVRMVGNFTELLAKQYQGQLDEKADQYIEFITDGARRMKTLINALLTFSRVSKEEAPFEPVECLTMINNVKINLKRVIEENQAAITHDALPTVNANASLLGMVFQNLISNGIKFCRGRKPEIHIGVEEQGRSWRFSVRDNGIGIDPQFAQKIFVIFQRLHTRSEFPGAGIGLSICKRIIQRHDGKIWLETQPGKGSIFYFTIPREGELNNGST
ncbi:MAG: CHASE domain-containing protein [Calditrichia bacterium]